MSKTQPLKATDSGINLDDDVNRENLDLLREMMDLLMGLDERLDPRLCYKLARYIGSLTAFEKASPAELAIVHYHIGFGQFYFKYNDHGAKHALAADKYLTTALSANPPAQDSDLRSSINALVVSALGVKWEGANEPAMDVSR